jgi:hypothetical protein
MDKTLQFLIADIEDRLAALKELVKAQQSEINRLNQVNRSISAYAAEAHRIAERGQA